MLKERLLSPVRLGADLVLAGMQHHVERGEAVRRARWWCTVTILAGACVGAWLGWHILVRVFRIPPDDLPIVFGLSIALGAVLVLYWLYWLWAKWQR